MDRITRIETIKESNGKFHEQFYCFGHLWGPAYFKKGSDDYEEYFKIVKRLALYEKSGLEPEEIEGLNFSSNQLRLVNLLEEEREKRRWIPCSERLPKESLESVIGWDEYSERCCFVQYWGGRWILGDDTESVKIVAWQPIPEPYKAKTKWRFSDGG